MADDGNVQDLSLAMQPDMLAPPPAPAPAPINAIPPLKVEPPPPQSPLGGGLRVPGVPPSIAAAAAAPAAVRGAAAPTIPGTGMANEEAMLKRLETDITGLEKQRAGLVPELNRAYDEQFAALKAQGETARARAAEEGEMLERQRATIEAPQPELRQERAPSYVKPQVPAQDLLMNMGVMATLAALFGSASRGPYSGAIAAMTGAMQGWQAQDDKMVKQAMDAYHENVARIRDDNEAAKAEWEAAKEKHKNDLEALTIEAKIIANKWDYASAQDDIRLKTSAAMIQKINTTQSQIEKGVETAEKLEATINDRIARRDAAQQAAADRRQQALDMAYLHEDLRNQRDPVISVMTNKGPRLMRQSEAMRIMGGAPSDDETAPPAEESPGPGKKESAPDEGLKITAVGKGSSNQQMLVNRANRVSLAAVEVERHMRIINSLPAGQSITAFQQVPADGSLGSAVKSALGKDISPQEAQFYSKAAAGMGIAGAIFQTGGYAPNEADIKTIQEQNTVHPGETLWTALFTTANAAATLRAGLEIFHPMSDEQTKMKADLLKRLAQYPDPEDVVWAQQHGRKPPRGKTQGEALANVPRRPGAAPAPAPAQTRSEF